MVFFFFSIVLVKEERKGIEKIEKSKGGKREQVGKEKRKKKKNLRIFQGGRRVRRGVHFKVWKKAIKNKIGIKTGRRPGSVSVPKRNTQ